MNILRHSDQKIFTENERSLMDLLREADETFPSDPIRGVWLEYSTSDGFSIQYEAEIGERVGVVVGSFTLDPTLYTVIPDNCVRKEDVQGCYEKIMGRGVVVGDNGFDNIRKAFNAIGIFRRP